MVKRRLKIFFILLALGMILSGWIALLNLVCGEVCRHENSLILSLSDYNDGEMNVMAQLTNRVYMQPFNLVSLFIFVCAILHTFFCHQLSELSQKLRERNLTHNNDYDETFAVEILHFLGEVEVVFGLWVIPLFFSLIYVYGWKTAVNYMDGLHVVEPVFVVVIMALASTAPIIKFAENVMQMMAKVGKDSVTAWWWVILTVGPIAGSLITEPAAMTISAFLLSRKFYKLKPSPKLAYATLGLLFVNVSVGGVFTHFAAPPVLMVSSAWKWDTMHMITHFGWKAFLGILIANFIYYFFFQAEFYKLEERNKVIRREEAGNHQKPIPLWIIIIHLMFLTWVVIHSHYPVLFIGAFLLFLGFYQATRAFQKVLDLRPPVLVGFFLAGLVAHGNLQGWWIEPLLGKATAGMLLGISILLTSFNDNAAVTYLATLIPHFDSAKKYSVVAGSVAGGGLTVIANAPNPAGQAILGKFFQYGISAAGLFCGALIPTIIMALCFYLL